MSENNTPIKPEPQTSIDENIFKEALYGRCNNNILGLLLISGKDYRSYNHPMASFSVGGFRDDELCLILDSITIDVSFLDTIRVDNLGCEGNPELNIICIDCILPNLVFSGSKIKSFHTLHSVVGKLWFHTLSKIDFISIGKGSESGDINLSEKSTCVSITIGNESQCKNVAIFSHSNCGQISIHSVSKCNDIRIADKSQCGNIRIGEESFCRNIDISNQSICRDIVIHKSETQLINIFDQYCQLQFWGATISRAIINNCVLQKLVWRSDSKGELYINGGFVNHLELNKTTLSKETILSLTSVSILVFQLEDLLILGQLILRDIKSIEKTQVPLWSPQIKKEFENWKIENTTSEIETRIYQSYENALLGKDKAYQEFISALLISFPDYPIFRIANSSLSKTEITGSDLTGFNFEYRDSKLLDCFISGTQLPKENINIYKNEDPERPIGNKDYYTQKVSFYNQLRKLYESLGDIVEASWYHSKAMDNQKNLLKLKYRENFKNTKKNLLQKVFSVQGFDLFTFRLNKISNNHEESWSRALFVIILSSFTIYSFYYISLFHHNSFDWSYKWQFISDYFSFLDITHKQNFLVEKPRSIAKCLDFLGRVVTGYCLYQFIAAFRRHGRKGI